MGPHIGEKAHRPPAATAHRTRRALRRRAAALAVAAPPPEHAPAPAIRTAPARSGFQYRPGAGRATPGPLPPLTAPHPPAGPDGRVPRLRAPSWSLLAVSLPLFAVVWACFVALAGMGPFAGADIAALGHRLGTGAAVLGIVFVTLLVAHTQVSGRRPRWGAFAVPMAGIGQGFVAAAISAGPSDLWAVAGHLLQIVGFAVPLAWVGGQFQNGVRRQRVELKASLIASWIERARHQAKETVESVRRHDARSVLFGIDGVTRALLDPRLPEEQRAPFIEMLTESVDRLGKLLDVRVEEIQPFDVAGLARAVAHAERKAGRTVRADLPTGLDAVGRAADVAAVLRTVIGLAARRTGAGVVVRGATEGGAIVLRVEPAGAGDLSLLTDCWDEVWAGSFKSASTDDDTTIDLYVATRLLAEQGADLWATAGRDRFAVRLPAAQDSGNQEEE